MADIVWTQHPSLRERAGSFIAVGALATLFAAGFWWVPHAAELMHLPSDWRPGIERVSRWMPLWLLAPALQIGLAWVTSRLVRYELNGQRLQISRGLLLKRVDNLELYRVRDLHLELPLIPRLLGVGNLVLHTIDQSNPKVSLIGVRDPHAVFARLRDAVEAARRQAGLTGLS